MPIKKSVLILIALFLNTPLFAQENGVRIGSDSQSVLGDTPRARQTIARAELVFQGYELYKVGKYDEAVKKFEEALQPLYIQKPSDKNGALAGLVNTKQVLGKYEEAYQLNEEKIRINNYRSDPSAIDWWRLRSQELNSLIEFQKTGRSEPVWSFVLDRRNVVCKLFKEKKIEYEEKLQFEKSLYLYEIIGDYDAALKLCDEYLAMKKVKKDKKFKAEVEDLRKTILEAKQTRGKNKIFKKLNEYGFYNWL